MKKIFVFFAAASLALCSCTSAFTGPERAPRKVAVQTYTFSDTPLDELGPVMKEVGVDSIGASGGLRLSKKYPGVRFNNAMTPEQREYAKKVLRESGLKIVSYGVVYSNSEADVENLCKFAKEFGCPVVITEDKPVQFKYWEKYGPRYGVKMALHNHATDNIKNNSYYNPRIVYELIKDYPSIYACADNGHWARSGIDTVEGHNVLKGKLAAIHLKDQTRFGDISSVCAPFGEGALDMKKVLENLDEQGYDGYLVIEYEGAKHPVAQVKKCVEFLRGN